MLTHTNKGLGKGWDRKWKWRSCLPESVPIQFNTFKCFDDLLLLFKDVDVGTGLDNIEVDPVTGDVWLGCHPITHAIIDFFNIFNWPHPSQVSRLQILKKKKLTLLSTRDANS